jgi:hypothetical protein
MFPLLLQVKSQKVYKEIIPLVISNLESLAESLDKYFPCLLSEIYDCVRDSCSFSPNSQSLLSLQGKQPTELQRDRTLKIKFNGHLMYFGFRLSFDLSKSNEHLTPVFNLLSL